MAKSPLDDLSFFKFPDVTPDVVRNIVILFAVIALTTVVTLLIQRFLNRMQWARQRRSALRRFVGGAHITPQQQIMLDKLLALSSAKRLHNLLDDASIYEHAVTRMVEDGNPGNIAELGKLRRLFHQNVMNPTLEFVNTRQLQPDLPLRLMASVGDEKLDLYCSLLDIDEQFLYFDLNYDQEIVDLVRAAPNVTLVYWRDRGGEAMFQLQLEMVPTEDGVPLFRARHEFRSEEDEQRADFRLSVNMPLQYSYVERDVMQKIRGAILNDVQAQVGKGRMVDLSFGGAAFYSERPLATDGIAQLKFNILRQPMRMMMEVRSNLMLNDGKYIVGGRWRGTEGEGRSILNRFLSREQLNRLREKGAFHSKPDG